MSAAEWVAAMTEQEWAAVDSWSRRSRARQGLPELLPADAVDRVRAVFGAADVAERSRAPPRRGDDPAVRRARRQALLGDLVDVVAGDP